MDGKKFEFKDIGFLALIVLVLLVTVYALWGMNSTPPPSWAEVRTLLETHQVDTVTVKDNTLTLVLKDGSQVTSKIASLQLFYDEFNDMLVEQKRLGYLTDYDYPADTTPAWWASLLPWLAVIGLFVLLLYTMFIRQAANSGGGGIGGTRANQFSRARTKTVNAEESR